MCAISGLALINSEDPIFNDPTALALLIDVLSERGYQAVVDMHKMDIPEQIDPANNQIRCTKKHVFRIQIRFPSSQFRRGLT